MMKSYAKKRDAVRAVQWTGEMTPEMTELVGTHQVYIDGDHQLTFSNTKGPGRFARKGDWMVSTSGEDLTVVGDDVFGKTYEEVDENGRSLSSTDEEHEAAGREFVGELDALLVKSLKLSREEHVNIFRERDRLLHRIRHLFDDVRYTAARHERHRIRNKISEDLTP